MDVWQLIERDHENIAQLIHDIPNALNSRGVIRSRERLLGDLIDQLETHAEAVDASLLTSLSRHSETGRLVEELRGEHHAFMQQLAGLARFRQRQSSGWLDAFGDATFLVDQHLHRHTHELIPAARKILRREEIEHATRMFIRSKTKALQARQRGTFGRMALSDLAVTATVCAAIGGLVLLVLRSSLFSGSGERLKRDTYESRRNNQRLLDGQKGSIEEAVAETFPGTDPLSPQRSTK